MGYIAHHAIIVTVYDAKRIDEAHTKALNCGLTVAGPRESPTNHYHSILICPDGSKEGWEESELGDAHRSDFLDWLNRQRFEDGSSPFAWIVVWYSPDDQQAKILEHTWTNKEPAT